MPSSRQCDPISYCCRTARKILEIGALGGYSGTWLAQALPADGRLITLEANPHHATTVQDTFAEAGLADRAEVRVVDAITLLPQLTPEAPCDLIFIDADKGNYPTDLDWAVMLSRVGTIIVADNVIREGRPFHNPHRPMRRAPAWRSIRPK